MPILEKETCLFPDYLLVEPPYLYSHPSNGDHVSERQWWAVYTKSRQEKSLARYLIGQDIPFYLPLIPKDNIIRARRVRL